MNSEKSSTYRSADQIAPVRVWDLPVRLVHWLIVVLVALSWFTAKNGLLEWHKLSGFSILSVIVFRIYWGFCGSYTARFAQFLRGPKTVARYARTLFERESHYAAFGHNPIGGWNVAAMLSVLILQIGLGAFSVDTDGLESGPLAAHVSFATGRQIAALHEVVFDVLLLLIGLHIVAVMVHLFYKGENLITPMLTGLTKARHVRIVPIFAPLWRALLGLAVIVLFISIIALSGDFIGG